MQTGKHSVIKTVAAVSSLLVTQLQLTNESLTRVEVFGFGQFDGGSSLFLQLDNGLTSLPNDRPRRIAGNQNLQEVLAFLCSGEQ